MSALRWIADTLRQGESLPQPIGSMGTAALPHAASDLRASIRRRSGSGVGPGAAFRLPSAAAAAPPGDTIRILPGTYYDCAVWQGDDLTIKGSGEATRITDRICQGKAIFVVTGRNVRIRNLAVVRARHLDGHGARRSGRKAGTSRWTGC